ncbi:hypothetical protein CQR49_0190 [Bifidobacterium pseudolongum subsp. pseudolongum]|uniref:Uncharacterized protein n=1 Tax=Bifidobacterium pseudolongum subsp. globosum TaxID=1690 RepID=A0A4Q5AR03_9BIFI|nr:hypothetical protein CQR52_1203 [Bifidobacterium pseudolongum subsp. pseudolongum]PKV08635.1 hypothetical protein CQR49_0190 [Bifidobacterium pseudolongum subsp. pseudolongum]RYQ32784.1 hypothetical protein PG2019B_0107 [Bifidobacterium pseudolongum subsp. globosum]RYQ38778.1 hypothetical protein PG2003B_0141 [Bifidobacterium pseudolongum subsp. globosum]RYQ71056.1 hypothetical protein PG2103B_0135 [Bifidobacterium pseudolongum subsp. globosum]
MLRNMFLHILGKHPSISVSQYVSVTESHTILKRTEMSMQPLR